MTPQDYQIAELRAKGVSYPQIEEITGIPKSTANDIVRKKSEVKALIESLQTQFIQHAAAKATQNIIDIVHNDSTEIDIIKEKNKYSAEILRAIGMLPSHTQSLIINQLNQVNNEIHLEGAAARALQHLGAIDVTSVGE